MVQGSRTACATLVEGIMGNMHVRAGMINRNIG